MQYYYLLFDLDGTLTDSKEGILRCVQYALEACKRPIPDIEKLMPFIGPPLSESFPKFCGMNESETNFAIQKYRERFSNIGIFENRVYDGIPELLEKLKSSGKILAVATSKPEIYAKRILDYFNLSQYFNVIAGSSIDHSKETKADMIRLAMKRLSLKLEDKKSVLMIGDRLHDIIGSKECGIDCAGVKYGYAPKGELEKYGANYILSNVHELENFLLSN